VAEDLGPEQPIVNVVGERVALGPLRRDLLPAYQRWANDLAANDRLALLPLPTTLERQTAWYDRVATASDSLTFTIYERLGWRAIGTCGLNEVDHRHGTAYLAILIGEPDARGRGHGTEAVRLLLDVAFTALGLHVVMLGVWEYNRAAIRSYEKAGFRVSGRRRQCCVMGGRRWDEVLMDCLATEFESPGLGRVFVPDEPRP
jgi:RimJ/RimL family protein N-acetyltransferase